MCNIWALGLCKSDNPGGSARKGRPTGAQGSVPDRTSFGPSTGGGVQKEGSIRDGQYPGAGRGYTGSVQVFGATKTETEQNQNVKRDESTNKKKVKKSKNKAEEKKERKKKH